METPIMETLLTSEQERLWRNLAEQIDRLYDVDRIWNKGFGDWVYEYKYRRGGKTLCTFYFKQDTLCLLIVLGKAEREKFEAQRETSRREFGACMTIRCPTTTASGFGFPWIPRHPLGTF